MSKHNFSVKVVKRFMNEEEFEAFLKKYEDNRENYRVASPADETDFAILSDHLTLGLNPRELSLKYNTSHSGVLTSIRKAALAKLVPNGTNSI